jgi:hypothetical protein
MNPHSGIDDNNKKDRTKAMAAAIPIAGMIVAAALLSGISLITSYQPAIAQQNMTAGGNATTTSPTTGGGGNATGSACAPTQTGGGGGAGGQNATTTATNATTGGGTNATTTGTTTGNATTTTASPVQLIEQACIAAQNNDTQGVLMNLNLALNALGGNMTTTADGEVEDEDGEGGEEEEGEGGEEEEGEGGEGGGAAG